MLQHIKRLIIGAVVLFVGVTVAAWLIANLVVTMYMIVAIVFTMSAYVFGLIIDDEFL